MANISHFTQTVNGVSTTYDIHDANAVPRSGGAVISGISLAHANTTEAQHYCGGTSTNTGAHFTAFGKDHNTSAGWAAMRANNGTEDCAVNLQPDGTMTKTKGSSVKNFAMQEDTVPRSGGQVMAGNFYRTNSTSSTAIGGGMSWNTGATITACGADHSSQAGLIILSPALSSSSLKYMYMKPNGTWTWDGTACQIISDQRLKQQIAEIDDKLLDAWKDVELSQFKYNDAVDTKGKDKARLHTGYVVQQIDSACKSHGVDISVYGLYCHEEYPQETEEVEVEQADGTKTKETKVIREASEHYSLRYTEVYAVECMYLRRCIKQLTARIEELEKGNNTK